MPPKSRSQVKNLVKLFEERQDAPPISPDRPERVQQERRSSVPNPPAQRPTPPRMTPRSVSAAAVPAQHPSARPEDANEAVVPVTPELVVPKAAWKPNHPRPAQLQTSRTHVTNVKVGDATKAIAEKLERTAAQHATECSKTAAEDHDETASKPAPIRDRFKHRPVSVVNERVQVAASISSAKTLVNPEPLEEEKLWPPYKRILSGMSTQSGSTSRTCAPSYQYSERPGMPASMSFGNISVATRDVPAYNVFLPTAKPLHLPLLDQYISDLPKVKFSEPDDVLSKEELQGWREWVNGASEPKPSRWKRLIARFSKGASARKGVYEPAKAYEADAGEKHLQKKNIEQLKRELIFPPMHLVPPRLTVTDLKENRTAKQPLVSFNSLLSTGINAVLGAEGSSTAASLIRMEAFRDLIQLIGLGVNYALPSSTRYSLPATHLLAALPEASKTRTIVLSVIPSILGLDFVSAFGKAILWLWLFTLLCMLACWEFKTMVGGVGISFGRPRNKAQTHNDLGEGLDIEEVHIQRQMGWRTRIRKSRGYKVCIIFLITSLYVPLSKISIGALVWTSDYWAVENYYTSSDNPTPAPLGPAEQFRDPLDFCYTTTMRISGLNWAVPILVVAALTVLVVTVWFPIRLWQVVRSEVPKIDPYTEMGEKRKDLKAEYNRLLKGDKSPFAFVYNDYRREWSGFKSAYMALKLVNVLAVTLLTKDNCLFRSRARVSLDVIRQSTLLGFMFCWMVLQIYARPFNDRMSNNSDWCSRIAYVIIAILGLAAALNLPGKAAYSGWLLVTVTILSYVFNGYFSAISTGFAQRLIKRWQRRLDFSIDVFSPNLDMPRHIARRIQQETISTLLLAAPEYKINSREPLYFGTAATSQESDPPPYLLAFTGTQGERHIENLKILREVGLQRYVSAADRERHLTSEKRTNGDDHRRFIEEHLTGPDCYWRPINTTPKALTSYFGRATVIPFPFTIVFRYDVTNTTVTLQEDSDLEAFVTQNQSDFIKAARRVRIALRALEGKRCTLPHQTIKHPGGFRRVFTRGVRVEYPVYFQTGVLKIARNSNLNWRGYNYNSGFAVSLAYSDGRRLRHNGTHEQGIELELDSAALGISGDFQLSPELARFFQLNRWLLDESNREMENRLREHRTFFAQEAAWKQATLSYAFLVDVYGDDCLEKRNLQASLSSEAAPNVRSLLSRHGGGITYMKERMQAANREILCQWWYIVWDDIWRRNHSTITQFDTHAIDFSPVYRASICYQPLPRKALESFLAQRGLWQNGGKSGFFTHGILNRIYFYLDETLFEGTRGGIPVKVGRHHHDVEFHELSRLKAFDEEDSFGQHTLRTHHTGQGTDHDDSVIRERRHFLFEEIYNQKADSRAKRGRIPFKPILAKLGEGIKAFLGLRPFQRTSTPPGLYFSLREASETYGAPRGL